jgi:hypothetical protein
MEFSMIQSNGMLSETLLAAVLGATINGVFNIMLEILKNSNTTIRQQPIDRKELLSFFIRWNISNILGLILLCGLFNGAVESLMLSKWIQNKSIWLIKNTIAWILGVCIIFVCHISGFWVGSIIGGFIGLVQIIPIRQHLYDGASFIHVINTSVAWTTGVFILQFMSFRSGLVEYIFATTIAGAVIGIVTFYPAFFLFAEFPSKKTP